MSVNTIFVWESPSELFKCPKARTQPQRFYCNSFGVGPGIISVMLLTRVYHAPRVENSSGFGRCLISCTGVLLPSFLYKLSCLKLNQTPSWLTSLTPAYHSRCLQMDPSQASAEQTAPLQKPSVTPHCPPWISKITHLSCKSLLRVAPTYFSSPVSLFTEPCISERLINLCPLNRP